MGGDTGLWEGGMGRERVVGEVDFVGRGRFSARIVLPLASNTFPPHFDTNT